MSIIPEVRVIKQECEKHGFVDHVIYPQCRQCQNEHLQRICEQARQNTKESPVNNTQLAQYKILLEKTMEVIETWRDSPEPGDASVFVAFEELDEFIAQNFAHAQ